MFAKLKGIIDTIEEDSITLDVSGVGYLVFVPTNLMVDRSIGEPITLHIQTIVKEDMIGLYGFDSDISKKLFNLLITVQGVGAKIALVILSRLSFDKIQQAIMFEDVNTLKTIPGIGIKVAQRLCNELKDKITKISISSVASVSIKHNISAKSNAVADAISVLQGLGYLPFEINKAIMALAIDNEENPEIIIKAVLQFFAQGMK